MDGPDIPTILVPGPARQPERRCTSCDSVLPDRGSLNGICPVCIARSMTISLTEDDGRYDLLEMFNSSLPTVSGYQMGPLAGSGGMGLVFRATHETDGSTVALKMLSSRWYDDKEQVARFEREARMLSQLDHPNIVKFIESGETDDGHLFMATEFVEGVDMRRRLVQKAMAPQEVFSIFEQICTAIEYAHSKNIVHRDLKPSNVLLGTDGSVKVADFGIAKPAPTGSAAVSLTQSNSTIGTPYYMAPESINNLSKATGRSDIYSLGVMLYELLTGSLPMGHFAPISKKTGLDPRFDDVIRKALAEDPAHRFGTVKEFRDAVQRLATPPPPRIWLRALAVIVILAAGGFAWAWQQHQQDLQRARPEYAASRANPYVNDLGMKFAPLPSHPVLFSLWETRIHDFETFAYETGTTEATEKPSSGIRVPGRSGWQEGPGATWKQPGWPVTPDHPACGVSFVEATAFCAWLTTRERAAGRITSEHIYRLPTSDEWQDAAARPSTTPGDSSTTEFIWGDTWPPPRGAGNLTGHEVTQPPWPSWNTLEYEDGYPRTAPVGQFAPSALGFFDLEGNVKEWCLPFPGGDSTVVPLRGAAWGTNAQRKLYGMRYLSLAEPKERHSLHGFRCVLEYAPANNHAPKP